MNPVWLYFLLFQFKKNLAVVQTWELKYQKADVRLNPESILRRFTPTRHATTAVLSRWNLVPRIRKRDPTEFIVRHLCGRFCMQTWKCTYRNLVIRDATIWFQYAMFQNVVWHLKPHLVRIYETMKDNIVISIFNLNYLLNNNEKMHAEKNIVEY